MDDIRRQDLKVFLRELFAIPRVAIVVCAVVLIGAVFRVDQGTLYSFVRAVPAWALVIGTATLTAYNSSLEKRFINRAIKRCGAAARTGSRALTKCSSA